MNLTIGGTEKLNGIRHFSISRDSCTNATAACRKYCYGSKGHFVFSDVRMAYQNNFELSKLDNFVEEMNKLLSPNERFFRIHAVGDFYDIDYFYKWVEIVKANPHITFLAYTRNRDVFGWEFTPENMKLIFSIDGDTDLSNMSDIMKNARKAFVVPSHYKTNEHLRQIGNVKICTSANCLKCLECWTGITYIGFPQKYPKYDP